MGNAPAVKKLHQHALDVWLISFGLEGMGFSTEKSAVWYLGHNRKSRLGLELFQCSFPDFQVKLNANVSLPQISNYNVMDCTYCALYSFWFLLSSCSLWALKMKVLCHFKMLGTTCPSPQYQIPEDLKPLLQRVENLRSHESKYPSRRNGLRYDYKPLWTEPGNSASVAYSGRKLYCFPFLVIAVSSGTFECAFKQCISTCNTHTLCSGRTRSSTASEQASRWTQSWASFIRLLPWSSNSLKSIMLHSIFNLSSRFWCFLREFHKKFSIYSLLAWF